MLNAAGTSADLCQFNSVVVTKRRISVTLKSDHLLCSDVITPPYAEISYPLSKRWFHLPPPWSENFVFNKIESTQDTKISRLSVHPIDLRNKVVPVMSALERILSWLLLVWTLVLFKESPMWYIFGDSGQPHRFPCGPHLGESWIGDTKRSWQSIGQIK